MNDRVKIELITKNLPVNLEVLEGFEETIVSFNTDIPYFNSPKEMKAFLFGAGSITDAHSSHEYVKIVDLKKAVEIYIKMMKILLG